MQSGNAKQPQGGWIYIGENLRRRNSSGVYYAFVKKGGKQFRRSLKTTDRQLANRRLADLANDLARLMPAESSNLTFSQAAERWLASRQHTVKESTARRWRQCLQAVTPFLSGQSIRNLRPAHCERWLMERGGKIAAQTFAHELDAMRAVFDYAMEQGWILRNPAGTIKRKRIVNKSQPVPTREQLLKIVDFIRADPRERGGGDLVELLAYSGMRLNEARQLRWRDVNFADGVFTVTGGETGTKNHEQRTVPMSEEMRELLEWIKTARNDAPGDCVIRIGSAIKSLKTACRKLNLPKFHHHSLRHYFTTCVVEAGVDIPTVARWLGHKDGGALLMKRYAHLQQAHSKEQMQRVSFKPKADTCGELLDAMENYTPPPVDEKLIEKLVKSRGRRSNRISMSKLFDEIMAEIPDEGEPQKTDLSRYISELRE